MNTPSREETVREEMLDFFRERDFACTPFKRMLLDAANPQSHVSVLGDDDQEIYEFYGKGMALTYGHSPAHVFVHPNKVTSEEGNIALAQRLNIDAATGIKLLTEGMDVDPEKIRAELRARLESMFQSDEDYDFVKEGTEANEKSVRLFATYMGPFLPEQDTRFSPYPLIAIVNTAVVAGVSQHVQGAIIESALERNGDRGFTGSYFPRKGLQGGDVLSQILEERKRESL
jgi:hypothetical protein